MIVEYLDAHRDEFGVDPICRVLSEQAGVQIGSSTYYAAKAQGPVSAAARVDACDANALFDVWVADRRLYGVRKLWHAATRAAHGWGRDRVARLCAWPASTVRCGVGGASRLPSATRARHHGIRT